VGLYSHKAHCSAFDRAPAVFGQRPPPFSRAAVQPFAPVHRFRIRRRGGVHLLGDGRRCSRLVTRDRSRRIAECILLVTKRAYRQPKPTSSGRTVEPRCPSQRLLARSAPSGAHKSRNRPLASARKRPFRRLRTGRKPVRSPRMWEYNPTKSASFALAENVSGKRSRRAQRKTVQRGADDRGLHRPVARDSAPIRRTWSSSAR